MQIYANLSLTWYRLLLAPNTFIQTLGIDSHELNRFRFSLLFFENSRRNLLALKPIGTELNLNLVNCELNWTELHTQYKELVEKLSYLLELNEAISLSSGDSPRTELILTISDRVYSGRLSLMQNRELNCIHERTELNWIHNSERELELNWILTESGNLQGSAFICVQWILRFSWNTYLPKQGTAEFCQNN